MSCIIEDTSISNGTCNAKEDSRLRNEFEKEYGYDLDKEIERPFNHIITVPGKLIRHQFMVALNEWMHVAQDKLDIIDEISFNMHNVSLLIDDIQDNSALRRGIPAAHTIFGIGNTINAGSFILQKTLGLVLELNHPEAVKIYFKAMLRATAGQGLDVYYRDEFICPTEEEYCDIVIGKTSAVFTAILQLMQLFSTVKTNPKPFTEGFGIYFQIRDDFNNLTSTDYFDSKGFCEDLSEGKFGFPVVHAVNSHPEEGKIIMDILRQRPEDIETKKYCLSLIEKCGSFEYTRNVLKERYAKLREEMDKFGPNPCIEKLIDEVYVVNL